MLPHRVFFTQVYFSGSRFSASNIDVGGHLQRLAQSATEFNSAGVSSRRLSWCMAAASSSSSSYSLLHRAQWTIYPTVFVIMRLFIALVTACRREGTLCRTCILDQTFTWCPHLKGVSQPNHVHKTIYLPTPGKKGSPHANYPPGTAGLYQLANRTAVRSAMARAGHDAPALEIVLFIFLQSNRVWHPPEAAHVVYGRSAFQTAHQATPQQFSKILRT